MPRTSDSGTIDQLASYAPPTSEGGQGGAFSGAKNDTRVASIYDELTAEELTAFHGPTTSGKRGGAD